MAKYKRILLKLSGESLMGEKQYGIDEKRLAEYAEQIKEIHGQGVQIGIVIGGGNIFRGLSGASKGFDRVKGDQMGMLATVINSLALSSALVATGVKARVLTAVRMEPIGEFYSKWKAIECMENGEVVIMSAGTGNPFFTTDTGSVIPRFKEQIENGGPVTVTHPDIIRFFMTIPEACRLVMEAATMGEGNEIFVFEMGKAVKIVDLATRMIELAGYRPGEDIKIEFTGLRPGEKLYEEVLSDKENTIPTENKKIMIAKVRRYEYADILDTYAEFEKLSRAVKIMDTVRLMKKIVPEFKSKNSPRFEVLDKE